MVVGIAGIGVGGTEEEGEGIFRLAIECYALIVDYLWQGQAGGDEGEGGFGLGVFGAVEAGKAEVEVGFKREAIRLGDLGKGGGSLIVLAIKIELLAEGEGGGGVGGGFGDRGLEVPEALLSSSGAGEGGIRAANVVFEGAEADAGRCGEEGLLGDGETWIDAASDLPGDGIFDVEEAAELGRVVKRGGEIQLRDFKDLRLDEDAGGRGRRGGGGLNVVAADDDVVGVERLRDAEGGGAGGTEVGGEAEVVEREEAVVMRDGEEA